MESSLSLLTLNVWNLNEPFHQRLNIFGEFIKETLPDVVCIQEVPVRDGHPIFPDAVEEVGYRVEWLLCGVWQGREEGVAVLSRLPMTIVGAPLLTEHPSDVGRGALAVRVKLRDGKTSALVATSHFAFRPEHESIRRVQAGEVARTISTVWRRFGVLPTIFAGDLNCTGDEAALRVLSAPTHAIHLRDLQAAAGLASSPTFAATNPYVSADLWPDRRIDYILASPHWSLDEFRIVLNDVVGGRLASDHFGLFARVKLA